MTTETINEVLKFRDDRNWKQFHNPKDLAISISLEAAELLKKVENPIILAGLGVSREDVSVELREFSEKHQIPVATSFMAKGVIPDTSELSLGVVGFFVEDYIDN